MAAAVQGANQKEYVYTKALPTNGFTEVVGQFEVDATPIRSVNSTITVTPEISNDGLNWETLTGDAFTAIDATITSFPWQDSKKLTTLAAFLRYQVEFNDTNAAQDIIATVLISAVGRS